MRTAIIVIPITPTRTAGPIGMRATIILAPSLITIRATSLTTILAISVIIILGYFFPMVGDGWRSVRARLANRGSLRLTKRASRHSGDLAIVAAVVASHGSF